MIAQLKALIVRFWPVLRLRTILFGVLLFVAALPGLSAVFLRVYENALVRRTEAELIAQSAAIAASAAILWPGYVATVKAKPERIIDVSTEIDLRLSPILQERPLPIKLALSPNPQAQAVANRLAPALEETKRITLSSILILDANGIILGGSEWVGSYREVGEVKAALAGRSETALRLNTTYSARTWLELFSQAANIRLHHARPIMVNGKVVGVVLVSRSPRALLRGIYEDRGKIAFGVGFIFILLIGISAILGRAIVGPIESLSVATRSLATGKRQAPKGSSLQVVEINTLFHDFDEMAKSIDLRARYLRDFAASVSHEFKTPLAGLSGAIELLQDHGTTMTETQRETFLANMAADTGRLSHLVRRLLDLARADMHVIDHAAATDIMSAVAIASDSLVGPKFGVKSIARTLPVTAAIDSPTLSAILMTILENARQAGATLVNIIVSADDTKITLAITNDGPAIPDGDKDRIFEPFFTSKRAQGGTGIGLSIARSLTRAYGGNLTLADDSEGVCFVLELPKVKT